MMKVYYLKKIIEEKNIIIENNKKKENKDFVNNNDINYYKNENIKLIEKNKELEELKNKNEENIFELIGLIKKAEEKMNELENYN